MTFEEAREELKNISGQECYAIGYEETFYVKGRKTVECYVYLAVEGLHKASTFREALNNLRHNMSLPVDTEDQAPKIQQED